MSEKPSAASATTDREIFIERVLNAPRALVFQAWADAERLRRWYAPEGCALSHCKLDFRPGGTIHTCIRAPNGKECWCTGVYREIVAPERIVFTVGASDAAGNAVEPIDLGMDPEWPGETVVTVTFAERAGQTLLTLHQTVSETLAKRTGAHPSWLQMLDRLAEEWAGT